MADTSSAIPVPTSDFILACVDLVIYTFMFPASIWLAWKHGKVGMVCWPIFVSYIVSRFINDIATIIERNNFLGAIPIIMFMNSASIACLTLVVIGVVFEVNMMLPRPPKRWTERILLGVTHLATTGGIATATYGGAPDPNHPGQLVNRNFSQIGNCLMLFVLFGTCWWYWSTHKRTLAFRSHFNYKPASLQLRAGMVAMVSQLVHVSYSVYVASNDVTGKQLDPVFGSFGTKFALMFLPQLGVSLAAVAAAFLGLRAKPVAKAVAISVESGAEDTESGGLCEVDATPTSNSQNLELGRFEYGSTRGANW